MSVMRILVRQIFEPGYMESLLEAFGIPRIGPGVRKGALLPRTQSLF